jgi:hypothetical protein
MKSGASAKRSTACQALAAPLLRRQEKNAPNDDRFNKVTKLVKLFIPSTQNLNP